MNKLIIVYNISINLVAAKNQPKHLINHPKTPAKQPITL